MSTRHLHSLLALVGTLLMLSARAFALNATWNTASGVPVTAPSYTASGTVNFTLNFAPATGTSLTVVNNTGLGFISGTFSNLAQGQSVVLGYGGVNYAFVANYYGGTGNDLVLQWANGRPVAWGDNDNGQLGNNTTGQSNVPGSVLQSGVLAGKTVIAVAAGGYHSLALCSDSTLAAWGWNLDGELGNNSTTESHVAVAVVQNGVLAGKTVVAVAAGYFHSLALCSDGTVAAWGDNSDGQLGNNSTAQSNVPVTAVQNGVFSGKTVVAVSAGLYHSLALCSDGTMAAWGNNGYGQLGNNTTISSSVPVAVVQTGILSGKTVIAVAAGGSHSLALCSDGTVVSWGDNTEGQSGNGLSQSSVPVAVSPSGALSGKMVTAISAGDDHSVALCSDGTVAAWGFGNFGQLGNNSNTSSNVPVSVLQSGVLSGKTITAVAAGDNSCYALCSDGTIAAWGEDYDGELGDNGASGTDSPVPVMVSTSTLATGERFTAVTSGPTAYFALALVASSYAPFTTSLPATSITVTGATLNGTVNANNSTAAPSFDYGTTASYGSNVTGTPATVTGGSATAVSATVTGLTPGTTYHYRVNGTNGAGTTNGNDLTFSTIATNANLANLVLSSGTLSPAFAPGTNSYTTTIASSSIMAATPTTADPNATVQVNGTTVTSGLTSGPLSMNVGTNTITIVVTAQDGVTTQTYTVAVTVTQAPALSWTYNTANDVPVASSGYNAAGNTVNLALNFAPPVGTNFTVVKNSGLFFIGGPFSNLAQGQVVTLTYGGIGYSFVANYYGGAGRDLVLQWADVRPMAWGNNADGELGNNNQTNSSVPVAVVQTSGTLFGKTVTSLSVGEEFVLALSSDGTVAGWGRNSSGQLGNNTTTGSLVPVALVQSGVLSGKTVIAVSAGAAHSLALCSDGTLATWGSNGNGELGNNSTTQSNVPVAVDRSGVLSGKTVVAVTTGMHHCLVLCSDGTLAAWGSNGNGQLGNNSTTDSHTPVAVAQNSGLLLGKTVIAITGGAYHNLVLCSDGTVAAWGSNVEGELGNNTTTGSSVPVAVTQTGTFSGKSVIAFAGGVEDSMGLCSDGTLATWGQNTYGELGNNSTTNSSVAGAINQFGALAGKMVVKVAAGEQHSLALCSDGTLAAWGYNNSGQLGNNSTTQSNGPVLVSTSALAIGERFATVSSGVTATHTAALVASPPSPLATTLAATSITSTSATLNGVVSPNSNSSATSFDYGPSMSYGTNLAGTPTPVTGNTAAAVSATISGLTPATTYHFRVNGVNVAGTGNGNDLTFRTLSNNANLSNLVLSSGTLSPAFASGTTNYNASIPNSTPSISVTPTVADSTATVKVNGVSVASGSASGLMNLVVGTNSTINIVVTAQDGTTQTYTVVATLAAAPPLSWTYNSAGDVPVTATGYGASGTATLTLNFAPAVGTNLMVVKNTGTNLISGTFSNLAQGQTITLGYNGVPYTFVVNYYGGTGNDLVLQWPNIRPVAWGADSLGQLGNNSMTNSLVPAPVLQSGVLAGKMVVAVAEGQSHSLALCSDGTVAAWGYNASGQLGNNSTTNSLVPVAVVQNGVLAGKTVVAVAAGQYHSLALCSDGTVAAWGYNSDGELGNNTPTNSSVPVVVFGTGVLSGKTVTAVAAGASHSLALCSDGTVAAWGLNSSGQLGNGSTSSSLVPVAARRTGVLSGKTVTAVAAGASHGLALCSDGTLAAWGNNSSGQLGNNSMVNSSVPVAVVQSGVLSGKTILTLSGGGSHSLAVCSDGTLGAWGLNSSGQLGNNSTTRSTVPVVVLQSGVLSGKTVTAVTAGASHSLALCSDGTVAAWGLNSSGQLGNSGTTNSLVPAIVSTSGLAAGETFVMGSTGQSANHTLALVASPLRSNSNLAALTLSGTLSPAFASGTTSYTATTANVSTVVTPTVADSAATVQVNGVTIASGSPSAPISLALGANVITTVVTAQDGTTTTYTVTLTRGPLTWTYNAVTDVPDSGSTYIASGTATLALNFAPPVGTNLMVVKNTGPGFISGMFSNLVQGQAVAMTYGGKNYSFVVNYYGGTGNDLVLQWPNIRPVAWGNDQYGQLGNNNTTTSNPLPVAVLQSGVLAGKAVSSVAAGQYHSLALCSDGTLAAWGNNQYGQLGNNGSTSTVPVVVLQSGALAGKMVVAIAAGQYHSLALCSDGTLAAWGNNSFGQLGNNSTTTSSVPVAVTTSGALSGKTVVAVAAGASHSLALCSDGTVAAWGNNFNGQLGNNSTTSSTIPVAVTRASGALVGKTVVAVASGASHSLALCSDGTLAAWGYNFYGQLGNGSIANSSVPVAVRQTSGVLASKTVVAIAAGQYHSLALCADGTVAAWGYGSDGELGNGSSSPSTTPVAVLQSGVLNGKTVTAVSAGASHCMALCSDGTLATWGWNTSGQLGNGNTGSSNVPVLTSTAILSPGERFVAASSGQSASHTLALVASPLHSNANLSNLMLGSGALSPAFASGTTSYTATTAAGGTSVIPTPADNTATVQVNGVPVASGSVSPPISLAPGVNAPINIVVTAQDGTTITYVVTVTSAPLVWTYNSPTDVPDSGSAYTASGTATLSLNFAPPTGTGLTVVKNTGPGLISGAFSNLAQGQAVTLSYGGVNYQFIANYYGGTGRDLVLQWANVRPVAWGDDVRGELGDNGVPAFRMVPVPVLQNGALAGKTITALSMGQYFSVALCSDGTVATWGNNGSGQLGNNSTTNSTVPVAVPQSGALAGKTIIAVAAGGYHILALCSDGTIAAWGSNNDGQLGNDTTTSSQIPVAVDLTGVLAGKTITAIAAGLSHSMALCSDGTLAAWGFNIFGQLGNNSTTDSSAPVAVLQTSGPVSGKAVTAIAAGYYHSLALCSDGTVAAWGFGGYGQLGNNSTTSSSVPVAVVQTGVLSGKTVTAVDAGGYHSLALCADGTVAAWGYNFTGQLGNNSSTSSSVPVAVVQTGVLSGKTVTAIAAGQLHNLALCSDGTVAAWGQSAYGELGDNSTASSSVPVLVLPSGALAGKTPVALAAGYEDSMALCSDGTLAAWGLDVFGELGDNGSFGYSQVPDSVIQSGVLAGKTVTVMSAGAYHTLALCSDGTLAAWGFNSYGQLGNNSTTDSNEPVAVDQTGVLAGKTIIAVAAGSSHSLALCSDGTLAAWGYNGYGQLGNNSTTQSTGPVAVLQSGVLSGKVVTAIAAGDNGSLALCSDGTVSTWGDNFYGQLGNNSNAFNSSVPVAVVQSGVLSSKTVTAIAAGQTHNLVLCSDGTLAAWGNGSSYQLGVNGFVNQSPVPVAVLQSGVLSGKTVTAIAAGEYHNLVLCSDGTLATWGINGTSGNPVPALVNQTSGALSGRMVVAIASGANHDLARCSDGTLATWGDNAYGQLGVNSTRAGSVPAIVNTSTLSAGEGFASASSGESANHTLALVAEFPVPTVATLAATSITTTGTTLNGTVNPNGQATAVQFQYGVDASYGSTATVILSPNNGISAQAVSANPSELLPGTTYHYTLSATSNGGTGSGSDLTFTTAFTPSAWRQAWYGTTANTDNAADTADPYGKGVQNLVVFAYLGPGQNPAQATPNQLPQPQIVGGNYVLSFTQPPGVSGVTYGAMWSSTLATGSWLPVADTGSGTTHTFSVPIGGNTQIFMELTATEP